MNHIFSVSSRLVVSYVYVLDDDDDDDHHHQHLPELEYPLLLTAEMRVYHMRGGWWVNYTAFNHIGEPHTLQKMLSADVARKLTFLCH